MEKLRRLSERVEEMEKKAAVNPDEMLLTSKEVAPYLGVSHHKTVERWVKTKGLPCVRVGRNLRFRLGDVRRWMAQRG